MPGGREPRRRRPLRRGLPREAAPLPPPASAPLLAGLRCALDRGGQNIELHVTFTGPVDMRDPEATERAIRRGVELAGRKLVRTLDGLDEVVGG